MTVSVATIARHLHRLGLVVPEPKKRPKSSYLRFEAEQPNECWQSDFTHYRLTRPDGRPGADTEIISWLDDHARFALHVSAHVSAHVRITAPLVLATFTAATAAHGYPASTLTDNGMVYTVRFSGGRGGRTSLEHELRRLGIKQKNSRPNHPTTCGKVERFQQTMKQWLRGQPDQPRHHRRAAGPPRRLRRPVQPSSAAPLTPAPGHPSDRLPRPAQGRAPSRPGR